MEIYKDIKGYENLYKISNQGNVFSLISNKVLSPVAHRTNNTTYYSVDLVKNKTKNRMLVHRLVAMEFLSNPDNKPCVNHIDNNGGNNHISNLEWVTYSENLKHAQKQGRLYEAQRKGGLVTSKLAAERAEIEAIDMVGKVFGTQKVVSHLGLIKVGTKGDVHRHNFQCICTKCGTETELLRESLKADKISCKPCSDKKKTLDRYRKIKESLINTKIKNWTIVGISEPTTTIRSSTVMIKCDCGHDDKIGYAKLSAKKIKKCKQCTKKDSSHFASLEATP